MLVTNRGKAVQNISIHYILLWQFVTDSFFEDCYDLNLSEFNFIIQTN